MKFFNLEITRRKAGEPYKRGGGFVSRWARPPSRNTAEWLDMFSKSPRLAVVERIASDLANLHGRLLRINPDSSETEIKSHPFLDLLERPNPLYEMTSPAIWRLNEIYLMLVGESFMLVERDENERPIELWTVPPHWVKMTPYLGNPGYLITSPSGLTMTVSVDDMFVMKQLNPLDPFMRGLGIAESIADEIEIDEYAAKFQKRFFYNDATPPYLLFLPGATKEQVDVFQSDWEKKHQGVDKSHRMAVLGGSGNITIEKLGDSHGKEMGFLESRLAIRDATLEHFGVPREIMGITENSNRATADAAQYIYAKNVLTPRIKNREQALNMQLLPMFGDNRLVWRFDPVIPYDKEFDKARALEGWGSGLLTKNEARDLLDMPNVEGGDVYKTSISDLFLREGDDPAKASQTILQSESDTSGAVPGQKSLSVNVEAMLRREDQALREHSRAFEAAVSRHFAGQRAAIGKALGIGQKAVDTPAFAGLEDYLLPDGTLHAELWNALGEAEQTRVAGRAASRLLDWSAESAKLKTLFTPLWKQAYEAGAKLSEETYGIASVTRPELVTPAKISGAKHIVGIEQTTKDSIADIIADGIADGVRQIDLKNAILDEMDATHRRAKLIAQQETSMCLAAGQFDTMKGAGARTKTWHHRPQKNPRDGTHGKVNHVAMEGETVGIDEKFSNGLRFPRDPEDDRPEEVIRCRCYLTYEFEGAPRTSVKPTQGSRTRQTEERPQDVSPSASEQTPADGDNRAFQPASDYRREDGSFDLETAKKDYRKFLQSAPEKNRIYLEQSLDAVRFEQTKLKASAFGYSAKKDSIVYDPSHPAFYRYDFRTVATHELGHRIDRFFVQSWEQSDFTQAIQRAAAVMEETPQLFIQYCKDYDDNGFLSDIMSGICKDKYIFPAEHDKDYWEKPHNQEMEIFTNLFALYSYQDKNKLAFLQEHFPDLLHDFNALKYTL